MPRVIIAKIEQLENKWIYLSKVMDALRTFSTCQNSMDFYKRNLTGNLRNLSEGI